MSAAGAHLTITVSNDAHVILRYGKPNLPLQVPVAVALLELCGGVEKDIF